MNKSQLEKGLAALQAAAEAGNDQARQRELMAKAADGTITPEENEELIKSLGGGDKLADQVLEPLDSETIQKSIDVSDYLREQHEGLSKGLATLAEHIQKSEAADQRFRVALAQTVTELASMVQAQGEQINKALGLPAEPVKSRGVVGAPAHDVAMEKSTVGPNDALTKSQVLDILEAMSRDESYGTGEGLSKSGENLSVAIAKYEMETAISPTLAAEVRDFHLNHQRTAA